MRPQSYALLAIMLLLAMVAVSKPAYSQPTDDLSGRDFCILAAQSGAALAQARRDGVTREQMQQSLGTQSHGQYLDLLRLLADFVYQGDDADPAWIAATILKGCNLT